MRAVVSILILIFMGFEAQARLSASPSMIQFYDTEVGSFGRSRTIYIQNNSDEDMTVSTSSSCYGGFSTTGSCGYINRYGSCTISVRFSPRVKGYQSCSITVRQTSGGFDQVTISISGRGVERRR